MSAEKRPRVLAHSYHIAPTNRRGTRSKSSPSQEYQDCVAIHPGVVQGIHNRTAAQTGNGTSITGTGSTFKHDTPSG